MNTVELHTTNANSSSLSTMMTLRTVSKAAGIAAIVLGNVAIGAATLVLASPVIAAVPGLMLTGLLSPSGAIAELFYLFCIHIPGTIGSSIYTASFMIPLGIAVAATVGTAALLGGTALLAHFAANKIAGNHGEETLSLTQFLAACTTSLCH